MKGLFIPGITAKMFKDASLESVEELMSEGKMYDIDYQEPSEDCISREDLKVPRFIMAENDYQKGWNDALNAVYENASSIQQKKGRWITNFHGFPPEPTTVCSECGFDRDYNIRPRYYHKIRFCPICGAEMESEE